VDLPFLAVLFLYWGLYPPSYEFTVQYTYLDEDFAFSRLPNIRLAGDEIALFGL
jgi:hypothetical protein